MSDEIPERKRVKVTVQRGDGRATVVEGVAAMAVTMQANTIPFAEGTSAEDLARALPDMPIVSLRADRADQLAVLLACAIASVREQIGPEGMAVAVELADIIQLGLGKRAQMRNILPPPPWERR